MVRKVYFVDDKHDNMQLNLSTFESEKSTETRVNESIASNLSLKGLDKISGLDEILKDIFCNYELKNGILKLINEKCSFCHGKLKRKGAYDKEITLPGGASLILTFHQYSCPKCKNKVDRKLGSWFHKGERYSSNMKADAVRLYLSHLSSYDEVRKELNKVYKTNLSKKTIRRWLKDIGKKAFKELDAQTHFSGHFVYDEEYMKVYLGDVGKKDAKLQRVEVYLLLFRDAVTKNVKLMLSDCLDKSILINSWKKFVDWTIKNNIPFLTLTTDGKREYNIMTNEINKEYNFNIKHAYCIFHLKKNLFEVSNKFIFGCMQTKKILPGNVLNQIKEIEKVIDSPTKQEFDKNLKILKQQINTFIKPLQDQIIRLRKYEKNYTLHKEFPFLRTTNTCEQWFGQTKPEKVKKGFKTKNGLINVLKALAVKYVFSC
ncbi:MAG: hypothetical protein KJ771_03830 [Nanoarchaeota archaeon]|nr:hypothetical protein [Nanoarchaeota archaeon]